MEIDFRTQRERELDAKKERILSLYRLYTAEAERQGVHVPKSRLYTLIGDKIGMTQQGVFAFFKRHHLEPQNP